MVGCSRMTTVAGGGGVMHCMICLSDSASQNGEHLAEVVQNKYIGRKMSNEIKIKKKHGPSEIRRSE